MTEDGSDTGFAVNIVVGGICVDKTVLLQMIAYMVIAGKILGYKASRPVFGDARLGKRSRARCGQAQGLLKTPAPLAHAYDVERCGSTDRPASAVQGASSPNTAASDIAMIR